MTMTVRKQIIAAIASTACVFTPVFAQQTTAIMDGRVLTGDGQTIEGGDVIIRDGRIAQVGSDLSAPAGARVIDASGKTVTPGIFAPVTTLGIEEISLDAEANDSGPNRGEGFPLGAALDAVDAIRSSSMVIPINRAGGVTRALVVPSPGDSLFGGKAAVIDLSGSDNSITRAGVAQVATLGYGGANRAGDTRMGSWAMMREMLDEARSYSANPNDYIRRAREGRHAIADLKALAPVVSGNQPVLAFVDGETDLRTLIRVKNAYGLRVIVVGGNEAWKVAPALAAANIPVILRPTSNLPSQFEDLGATLENAVRLHRAGVTIAFTGTDSDSFNLTALTHLGGIAVASGLPYDTAVAALTRNPAEMFGLGDDLGTVAPGKIADIVLWDGDPLEVTSAAEMVFINGAEQDLSNRQSALLARYRDLSRGALPHAYRGGE